MKQVPLKDIKPNPNNPRVIKDDKFAKLVQSLKDLPEMASVRPIVVNQDMIVLGGNMRLKAMKEAGWKQAPVEIVDWDEDKQRQFIIKDNVGFGEWDWEMLANEWDAEQLEDWGLDIPAFDEPKELEAKEDNYEIPDEIKVEEYLRTNGVAEGEVLKWINKFDIKISDHPVKDKIFYFENFDFFNYSPFEDFKMFVSKNEPMTVWVGEKPILEKELPSKLRIVFHGFNELESIRLYIDGIRYQIEPKEWEIIEFDIDSLEIRSFFIEYKNRRIDFMGTYRSITMNQVYYNHRP